MAKPSQARNLPTFFRGQQQSEEFARCAWAACDVVAKMHAGNPTANSSTEKLTAKFADEFNDHVAKGGDYSRGFVTAVVEILAFDACLGSPDFNVWRPLAMDLRFTARGAHPTPGSRLYELAGAAAVSVAPDLTVTVWRDYDEGRLKRGADFLARVQKRGRPISAREFDTLRRRTDSAAGQSEASHG